MPVIKSPDEYNTNDLYVDLDPVVDLPLFLKCEGMNFAGSVKLKAAREMIAVAEESGVLTEDSVLIESSSGNLGVALSMIAANRGLRFVCVTDIRCNLATRQFMEALGAEVHMITTPDPRKGLLGARLELIKQLCAANPNYLWLNQYANPSNWLAHFRGTGPEIVRRFPDLGVMFVGAGTTGTLMGCARYFRTTGRPVRIVAVDSVGSVTFGTPPAPRLIPGLGTSVTPPLLDRSLVDDILHVTEEDTVRMCHRLARKGFLFGGSTGTVLAGAAAWFATHDAVTGSAVALAPDLGERYLDTIYHQTWVESAYGMTAWPESSRQHQTT